jgi:DNA polymerase elongation subunit (family B)
MLYKKSLFFVQNILLLNNKIILLLRDINTNQLIKVDVDDYLFSIEFLDIHKDKILNILHHSDIQKEGYKYNLLDCKLKRNNSNDKYEIIKNKITQLFFIKPLSKKYIDILKSNNLLKYIINNGIKEELKFSKYTNIKLFNVYEFEIYNKNKTGLIEKYCIYCEDDLCERIIFKPLNNEYMPNFKVLCYDIETSTEKYEDNFSDDHTDYISSISFITFNINNPELQQKYCYLYHNSVKINHIENRKDYKIIIFNNQTDMIKSFTDDYFNIVDITYGYNSCGFDDIYISKFCEKYTELNFDKFVLRFDLLTFIKQFDCNCKKYNSLKLKDVCEYNFKSNDDKKINVSYSKLNKLFIDFRNSQNSNLNKIYEILDYNVQDVNITIKLDNKLGGLSQSLLISKLTGESINKFTGKFSGGSSQVLSSYLFLELSDCYIDTEPNTTKTTYKGALVKFNETLNNGFIENIYPFDFASLYPNVIRTFNICTSTLNNNYNFDKFEDYNNNDFNILRWEEEDKIYEYEYLKKEKFEGIIPKILTNLLNQRSKYKKLLKIAKKNNNKIDELYYNNLQLTTKLLCNSIYGIFGQQTKNRYTIHNRIIGASVCYGGRISLNTLIEVLTGNITRDNILTNKVDNFEDLRIRLKNRAQFIYADTDSTYIKFDCNNYENRKYFEKELIDYVKECFKYPMVAEFEGFISHQLQTKKKTYIFYQDNKLKTKGDKRTDTKLIINFRNQIFNQFRGDLVPINDNLKLQKYLSDYQIKYIQNIKKDIIKSLNINNYDKFLKSIGVFIKINKIEKNNISTTKKTKYLEEFNKKIDKYIKSENIKHDDCIKSLINKINKFVKFNYDDLYLLGDTRRTFYNLFNYDKILIQQIKIKEKYNHKFLNNINVLNWATPKEIFDNKLDIDFDYYINIIKSYIYTGFFIGEKQTLNKDDFINWIYKHYNINDNENLRINFKNMVKDSKHIYNLKQTDIKNYILEDNKLCKIFNLKIKKITPTKEEFINWFNVKFKHTRNKEDFIRITDIKKLTKDIYKINNKDILKYIQSDSNINNFYRTKTRINKKQLKNIIVEYKIY